MAEHKALTVEQVAELLQLNTRSVYRLIERRELRGVRIGRAVRIPIHAVDEYLAGSIA